MGLPKRSLSHRLGVDMAPSTLPTSPAASQSREGRKVPKLGKKARLVGAGIIVREEGKEGMREGKEKEDGERKGRRKREREGGRDGIEES